MGATTPIESWQFFTESLAALGMPTLQRIFGNVSTTSIYRWGRKPGELADWQPGPLPNMAELLRQLVQQGRADLAEAGLRILAEPCGAQVSFGALPADPPQPETAAAELVEAVAEVQRAARTGADLKIVDALAGVLSTRAMVLAQSVRQAQTSGQRPRWSRGQPPAASPKPGWSLFARFGRG